MKKNKFITIVLDYVESNRRNWFLCLKTFLFYFGVLFLISCNSGKNYIGTTKNNFDKSVNFRIMVYNIKYGQGIDGKIDLERIAKVIEDSGAELVAINEIDRRYGSRSNYKDQLQILADLLSMNYEFQKTSWKDPNADSGNEPREFGHALLSKHFLKTLSTKIFTAHGKHYRGLLEAELIIEGKAFFVYVTHLDVDVESRNSQVKQMKEWLEERAGPKILLGDLNMTPEDSNMVYLKENLIDAFEEKNKSFTYRSNNPTKRIDYILGSPELEFRNSKVIHSLASDHFPILTDVSMSISE